MNKQKSKLRARVEPVFGFMSTSMRGLFLKSIGLERAQGFGTLVNLTYNLWRYEQIKSLKLDVKWAKN